MSATVGVHVLVSRRLKEELRLLSQSRRLTQTELIRQSVEALLLKYSRRRNPRDYNDADEPAEVSLVVRLPREQVARLKELSARTRILQSLFLREALAGLHKD